MKNVKWLSLVLALVLCLFTLPAQAEVQVETHTALPAIDLPDNDELFAGYVEKQLYAELYGGISTFGTGAYSAGSRLEGTAALIYEKLAAQVKNIAANGTGTADTIFTFGTQVNTVDGLLKPDYSCTITEADSSFVDLALQAVIADHPYEMYWFDKGTEGYAYSAYVTETGAPIFIEISFAVAPAYQNGAQYTVSAASAKVQAAVEEAQAVVAANASLSDMEKLEAYKAYICGAVSYNTNAVTNKEAYGDPWQLIYVFDGDSSTNVVCEGYSKAFQYLCDLSTFTDAVCYTVSGTMAAPDESGVVGAGPHMWNIVSMGGKNYLVDVTNSEESTVGLGGELFMARAQQGGSGADGYVVLGYNNAPVTYKYDSDQESLWGEGVLKLAENVPVASITSGTTVTKYMDFADAVAAWTNGTTLTLLDNVTYDAYIEPGAGTRTFVGGKHTLDLGSANINNTGTLTITSGTITADNMAGGTIENWGELIINGNSVISNNENAAVVNFNKFEATGGTLTASTGLDNEDDGVAVLNGTTLSNVLTWGNVTLTNCTITLDDSSTQHLDFRGGKVTINGDCAGWRVIYIGDNSAVVGTDIVLPDNYYLFRNATIIPTLEYHEEATIGKHTSADHKYEYTPNGDGLTHDKTCTVGCGVGETNVPHTAPDAEGKCVCGAQLVAKVGGTYYADFGKAVAAWTDGTTLTLLDDVSYDSNINLGAGTRTFVGGEHTLTLTSEANRIYNDGTLTIASGTITSEGSYAIQNSGTLNIEGGIVSAPAVEGIAVENMDGKLTISGGTVSAAAFGG